MALSPRIVGWNLPFLVDLIDVPFLVFGDRRIRMQGNSGSVIWLSIFPSRRSMRCRALLPRGSACGHSLGGLALTASTPCLPLRAGPCFLTRRCPTPATMPAYSPGSSPSTAVDPQAPSENWHYAERRTTHVHCKVPPFSLDWCCISVAKPQRTFRL